MPTTHHALVTLALALALGLLLTVAANRLKFPSLILLLGGGILFGPEGLGFLDPGSLGDFLPVVVSLAVSVILFEGGLTLDIQGYLRGSTVIKRLLSLGVVVTWLGASAAVEFFFHIGYPLALLSGSLVIVTGPTVIAPLLKRIRIQPRVHHILQWEGVLIDSIGVFIALLCFEWVTSHSGGGQAVLNFGLRAATGIVMGVVGGWAIYLALKWRLAPDSLVNAFALALAVLLFALSETVQPEAGLLAVTLAGLIVGWKRPVDLRKIREFKGELTEILIGMLFMLLSARLDLGRFREFGVPGLMAVGLLLLVVRPVSILLCTWGSDLNWREKVFLSWISPRGIVAASMASLFSLALARRAPAGFDPRFVETFTYSVIVATVVLQGFSAGPLAWALRLRRPPPSGWLVLGAHGFPRRVAAFLARCTGAPVTLLDRNAREAALAAQEGLNVITGDALEPEPLVGRDDIVAAGYLLALTDNSDLNELACHRWSEHIPRDNLFRWSTDGSSRVRQITLGQPVWNELPRPGLVSAELLSGESLLEELVVDQPAPLPPQAIALLLARDGRVQPVTGRRLALKKGDRLLLLRRTGSYLANALSAGALVDMPVSSTQAPYLELIEPLRALYPALDSKAVSAELQRRAAEFSFDIGRGVSVPHAYAPGLQQRVCLLARDPSFGNLTFLVLSPHADADSHLATLGEIARICDVPKDRQALLEAPDLPGLVALTRNFAQTR